MDDRISSDDFNTFGLVEREIFDVLLSGNAYVDPMDRLACDMMGEGSIMKVDATKEALDRIARVLTGNDCLENPAFKDAVYRVFGEAKTPHP